MRILSFLFTTRTLKWVSLWAALLTTSALFAQHPFYLQAYDSGVQAMKLKNNEAALEYLEIAAFGLLEYPEYLSDIYVRWAVLLHEDESSRERFLQITARAKRLIGDDYQKPAKVDAALWERFLVVSGRKAPPPPPIPADEAALRRYVAAYPKNKEAWRALIQQDLSGRESRARETLAAAIEQHPDDPAMLEQALAFAVNRDRSRSAETYASKLYQIQPESAVVNEYYGIVAVEQAKWDDAARFLQKVGATPILRETAAAVDALARQRKREAEQRTKDEERRAKIEAKQQADDARAKQKELAEEKARLAKLEAEKQRLEKTQADELARLEAKRKAEAAEKPRTRDKERDTPTAAKTTPKGTEVAGASADPIQILETKLRQNKDDLEVRYQLTERFLDRNDLRKAGKELRRLGKSDGAAARYIEVYARYNYLTERYKRNTDLGDRGDLSERARYFVGMSFFREERLDEAVALLKGLSRKSYPDLREVDQAFKQVNRTDAKVREQTLKDRSIQQLERRVERGSARPIDLIQLIELYVERADFEKATPLIEDGQKRYRANQEFRYFAGRLDLHRNKYSDAAQAFQSLINAGYRKRDIYFYAGMAAMNNGQEAVADYLFKLAVRDNVTLEKRIQDARANRR